MKVSDVMNTLFIIILGIAMALFLTMQTSESNFKKLRAEEKSDYFASGKETQSDDREKRASNFVRDDSSTKAEIESRVILTILRWDGKPSEEGVCEVYTRGTDGSKKEIHEYKNGACEFVCKSDYARVVIIPETFRSEYSIEKDDYVHTDLDSDCGPVFLDLYPKNGEKIVQTISLPVAYKIVCLVTDVTGAPVDHATVSVWNEGPELKEELGGIPLGSVGTYAEDITDETGETTVHSVMPGASLRVTKWIPLADPDDPATYDDPEKIRTVDVEFNVYPSKQNEAIKIVLPFSIKDYPYYVGNPYESKEENPPERDK